MAGSGQLNNRKPYNGDRRAVVIAFDVGTTFSGVSYAFLEPGEVPKIHGVTRYPGQEHVTGNTKIPSLLYYDRTGKVVAAGAEAETGQIIDQADDEGWYKVELFKLRLRPRRMELDMNGMRLSPLPPGKSSEDVFGDFLAYLFSCTRKFIEDTHANGKNLWHAVSNDIHFVLSHPNGWEGPQQARMRRAAISGGLIPNTDEGKARIRFVTEGEASMHACILSGLAHDVLASGNGFIVADAGGGTLDVSSYILRGTHPLQIEEVAPPDCVFSGAVFVSRRCRVFLEGKLRDSKYGSSDILDHITKRFDETTKRLFRDKNDPQYIQFGSPLDKDLKVGIRGGQLKLLGTEVADLFEPSIQAAVASIRRQIELSRGAVKAVWLVGGFAASSWLFSQLQKRLAPLGVTVNRPDNQTSKAVADGAIGFFCDHHVSARMSRYMYGVEYLREIDVNDEEHLTRSGRQLQLPSGPKYLPDAFDCILAKNVRVKESSVFSRKYYTEVTKLSTLSVFEIEIWCYRGGETIPRWIDRNSDQFGSLCFVRADLSRLSNSAEPKKGANGQTYWTVIFTIEIHFGLTEFKARMKWNEDGKTKYGPATIVYNEKGVRSDEDDAYSVAGGDESTSVSPRRPYGSLLNHSSRHASSAARSSRRTTDRGSQRERSQRARAPSLSGPDMNRSMSGQTDGSVETVVHDPSPPLSAPPITSSVSGSVRRSSRSRGVSSTAPSAREQEPEPPLEHEREPSLHSRAPSMYSRVPSATAAMSSHSRAPSTVVAPSVHSRTPSVAAPPSIHSRAPSAATPPSMHSRTPSAAAPPSMHSRTPSFAQAPSVVHSRTPSAAPPEPPVVSRTPSFAPAASAGPPSAGPPSRAPSATRGVSPAASRAPSGAPAASPAASRPPSVGSRPSVSRAPSSGSRVPTVTRQSSSRSGPGSRVPSHMQSLDEGDMYVNTDPDVAGSAAEYFNTPSNPLDGSRTKSRSISPAPPVGEAPQLDDWETQIPTVSIAPPAAEDKKDKPRGWGIGSALGSMFGSNSKHGEAADPLAAPGDVPLESFGNAEEPFVPPAPGGVSWGDMGDAPPAAPGGWGAEPVVPEPVTQEPEVSVPPVGKSSSSKSTASKKKQPKSILKNGSAGSAWNDGFGATIPAPGGWEDISAPSVPDPAAATPAPEPPAPASAPKPEPEPEPIVPESEIVAPPIAKTTSGKSGKGKKKGVSKNGTTSSKAAEAEAKAKEEAEAKQKAAESEAARAKAEAEELAGLREEEEALAREQAEMERRERESAEEAAGQQREWEAAEEARLRAEAEQKVREEERLAQTEREEAAAREREAREREEAEAHAQAEAEKARLEQEVAAAAAEAKAREEEAAAAKASAEAGAANAAAQEQEHSEEDQRGADAGAGVGEADAGAPSAAAVDDKKTKLQEAVEKAEKDFEKAEEEFNKAEVELAKVQKAPAKGGKKKNNKSAPSPAEKSKERVVQVAKTKMDAAKTKLENAKAERAAYAGEAPTAEATDPPAPPEEPEEVSPDSSENAPAAGTKKKDKKKKKNATTLENDDENEAEKPFEPPASEDPLELPPLSKASSYTNGKGKKSAFSFAALDNDDGGQDADDNDGGGGERDRGGEPIAEGLFGGSNNTGFSFGGGWGLPNPIGGGNKSANKAGGKTGTGWFDF